MLRCPSDHIKNLVDGLDGNLGVEQIRHRAGEDLLRLPPMERILQAFRMERQIKSIFEGMTRNPSALLCDPLSVTVVAAWT